MVIEYCLTSISIVAETVVVHTCNRSKSEACLFIRKTCIRKLPQRELDSRPKHIPRKTNIQYLNVHLKHTH